MFAERKLLAVCTGDIAALLFIFSVTERVTASIYPERLQLIPINGDRRKIELLKDKRAPIIYPGKSTERSLRRICKRCRLFSCSLSSFKSTRPAAGRIKATYMYVLSTRSFTHCSGCVKEGERMAQYR
jgi:hypothetical protein